jgi:hypothetical protein
MIKEQKIYWLFSDNSIAHIKGKPFSNKPIAFKLNYYHNWNYDIFKAPNNYYSI